MLDIFAAVISALYVGYASVVYGRLRTRSQLQAEIAETRSWVRYTPPFCYIAALLVPAMPLIAELTCAVNGLLWPAEMITRPWRHRLSGPRSGRS